MAIASRPSGVYVNEVVQEYLDEVLDTYFNAAGSCNVDRSLEANDGDTINIFRYSDTGAAEEVEEGSGNTGYSDIVGRNYKYTIKTVQDRCNITDEEQQRNSNATDMKVGILGKHLINKINKDIFVEWEKSTNYFEVAASTGIPTVAEFITAQAELDLGVDGGFNGGAPAYKYYISPKDWRLFQVNLQASNVLVQYDIINGVRQMSVNGVAVEVSDLAHDGASFFATQDAVRLLLAPSVSVESERDANTRTSVYYARNVYNPYLEWDKKVVLLGKGVTLTKTVPTHGTFTLPAKAVIGQRVYLKDITPDSGYKAGVLSVSSATTGVTVKVFDDYSFEVPEDLGTLTVALTFVSA